MKPKCRFCDKPSSYIPKADEIACCNYHVQQYIKYTERQERLDKELDEQEAKKEEDGNCD